MNSKLSPAPPPLPLLRTMEIGELLDEAFDLYKKNFRLLLTITVLLPVPIGVLLLATPERSGWRYGVTALSYLAGFLTTGALTAASLERYLGRATTVTAAFRVAARRYLRLLSGYLIYGLAFLGGLIAFVVPAFYVGMWALLMLPIVIVENRGGVAAFARARQIAAGQLWRLFFVGLALALVVIIFIMVLGGLAALAAALLGTGQMQTPDRTSRTALLLQAGTLVLSVLFQAAWSPVIAAAQVLIYLDLRIRREAYDVELLTAAVEERAAAVRAAVPPLGPPE